MLFEIQRHRLAGIASHAVEPMSEREWFFLWTLRAGEKPNLHDYILPPLLFHAEMAALKNKADLSADQPPPTAS